MKNVAPALLLSVPCPICEVEAGNPCVFNSGVLRSKPHLDRKMLAADDVEEKRIERRRARSVSARVMELFGTMGEDRLELHVLFGAAGNGTKEKIKVIDAIDDLVRTGMLDACSDGFYALKDKTDGRWRGTTLAPVAAPFSSGAYAPKPEYPVPD